MQEDDYLLKDKAKLKYTRDVFDDSFDITWFGNDQNRGIKNFTILPDEKSNNVSDDGTVSYQYNEECFRCDNFKETHTGKHILFAGCSQTEGVGGNINDIWTKMFNDSIKDSDGFYTIARAGFGWQKVITNFMIYIKKYGIPEYLFILLPNVSRSFSWSDEKQYFSYDQRYPEYYLENSKMGDPLFAVYPEEYKKHLIDFKISWNMFEKYCKSIGIKMLWSTWESLDSMNIQFMDGWDSFINVTDNEHFMKFVNEHYKTNKIKKDDMQRRDGHYGTVYNKYWAKRFYEEAKARWDI